MKTIKKVLSEADIVAKKIFDEKIFDKDESEMDLQDAAIIGLLEDMIGKTKSLILLLENKNHNGVDALARMIFENYVFLMYILEKDTKRRGMAYIYSAKLKELEMYEAYTEVSLRGSELRSFLNISRDKFLELFPKLNNPNYKTEIEKEYAEVINNKNVKANWFNENGSRKKFFDLCKYLGLEKEYRTIYRIFSNEVHAKEALKYFNFKENYVGVLRKYVHPELHISIISMFLMESTRNIYKYYGMKKELKRYNTMLNINWKYLKQANKMK